jgi:hypothetical protein
MLGALADVKVLTAVKSPSGIQQCQKTFMQEEMGKKVHLRLVTCVAKHAEIEFPIAICAQL